MNLSIGFKGQITIAAQAVPMQEGYLKLGGWVDESQTSGLKFGVVVSANPDTPNNFVAGLSSRNVFRGICIFDDAIAANSPAHPTSYLIGMPCAALAQGLCFVNGWTKNATGAIDPVIGCKAIFNTTTGAIEFVAGSTSSAPEGYAFIPSCTVKDIDEDNGALLCLA